MKISINYYGQTFDVKADFTHTKTGHGHWNIVASVSFQGEEKNFPFHFTNSSFIDEIETLRKEEGYSDTKVQQMYYDQISSDFDERIGEWCEEVDSTQVEN